MKTKTPDGPVFDTTDLDALAAQLTAELPTFDNPALDALSAQLTAELADIERGACAKG